MTRIVLSTADNTWRPMRLHQFARWASAVPAAGFFGQVASCADGLVLYGAWAPEIEGRTLGQIERDHSVSPARLADFLAAARSLLKILLINEEGWVEELVAAASGYADTLLIVSSLPGVLRKVQDQLADVAIGLRLGDAGVQTEGELRELLRRAGRPPFLFVPGHLLSDSALRNCEERMIVQANTPAVIHEAMVADWVDGVVTRRLGDALTLREHR